MTERRFKKVISMAKWLTPQPSWTSFVSPKIVCDDIIFHAMSRNDGDDGWLGK